MSEVKPLDDKSYKSLCNRIDAGLLCEYYPLPPECHAIIKSLRARLDRSADLLSEQRERTAAAESMEQHVKGGRDNLRKAYAALEAERDEAVAKAERLAKRITDRGGLSQIDHNAEMAERYAEITQDQGAATK